VAKVRVISADGKMIGILSTPEAIERAREVGLDLLEVSPNANPPVCRILDIGKYKYEQRKKEKESKKKQHTVTIKEIRLRPKTDQHDLETKLNHARKFIEQKNKVKFTLIFRGREMAYQDLGRDLLNRVIELLEDVAKPDGELRMEGRRLLLVLSPKN
jgi:translation initiation factor IF-3